MEEFKPRPKDTACSILWRGERDSPHHASVLLFFIYKSNPMTGIAPVSVSLRAFQEFLLFKVGEGNHPYENKT